MTIQIFDNFLDTEYLTHLRELFFTFPGIPWYYNSAVVGDRNDSDSFQFTHVVYTNACPQSSLYEELVPCLQRLNPLALVRIKANLLTKTEKHIEHGFHVDVPEMGYDNLRTAILYMNTNNGYTLFENGEKVNSVENRLVVFNSQLQHTGATCTDEKVRIVINFNYF